MLWVISFKERVNAWPAISTSKERWALLRASRRIRRCGALIRALQAPRLAELAAVLAGHDISAATQAIVALADAVGARRERC